MALHRLTETIYTIREPMWQEWEDTIRERQSFLIQVAGKMEQTQGCLYYRYEPQTASRQLSRYEIWQNGKEPMRREDILPEDWLRTLAEIEECYSEGASMKVHEVYLADQVNSREAGSTKEQVNGHESVNGQAAFSEQGTNKVQKIDNVCVTEKGVMAEKTAAVCVPGSKSLTNRALLLAALSQGEVILDGVLFSDDSRHFLSCLETLGFALAVDEKEKRVVVKGEGGRIPRKEAVVDVGSAGTAARFITAMLALSDGTYTIQCSAQMEKRPMKPLFDVLKEMGAAFTYLRKEGFLPVKVVGNRYRLSGVDNGSLAKNMTAVSEESVESGNQEKQPADEMVEMGETITAGETIKTGEAMAAGRESVRRLRMDIRKSTQFLSALLMVLPVRKEDTIIEIEGEKKTGAYIQITQQMLRDFGAEAAFDGEQYHIRGRQQMRKKHYQIEPDMSAACYFFAAAAITGGRVTVRNVSRNSVQGDRRFLEVLEMLGCTVTETQDGICVQGTPGGVYDGVDVDMNNFSDQALTLAAVAAFAKTDTVIRNVAHIRGQESDRMRAIVTELDRCGIHAEQTETDIVIHAGKVHGALIRTYEDHRVAMAFTLLSLRVKGIVIDDPMCCRKTFEEFYDVFEEYRGM